MGYTNESKHRRWGLPTGILALVLGLVMMSIGVSTPSLAATISCGQCHSNPPVDADSGGCKLTTKSHPAHSTGADLTTCNRCHPSVAAPGHPTTKHINNVTNITSVISVGMRYNTTTLACTNTCHTNQASSTWGGGNNCNLCHFRSGAIGAVAPTGLHVTNDKSWKHYSSSIKVYDNTKTITCSMCHPNNDADSVAPRSHITPNTTDPNYKKRADMSMSFQNVTVTGIGYAKGVTAGTGTCSLSCHYNPTDPFGNRTIYFKPGQTKKFGAYQSAHWGDVDLKCNECHSTPSQEATFGNITSTIIIGNMTSAASKNANKRHEAHMFKYKLNPWNFAAEDRNIYCDDCHKTPDINLTRGFQHHSTIGQGGSKAISLPVKSQNARVSLDFRNNGKGRDKINPATFTRGTCSNIYCHTIMTNGLWTEESCDSCHGIKNGVNVGSGAPGYSEYTSTSKTFEDYSGGGGAHYTHVTKRGYPCRTCHYDGGGDGNPANHHNLSARTVVRANVNVGVQPAYWFNNRTSYYNKTTRSCSDVKCHYGASQNWDCTPLK